MIRVVLTLILITLVTLILLTSGACAGMPTSQDTFRLDHAKPYLVMSERHLSNEDPSRSVGLWLITSKGASGFEEYAQTAIQAALDLYDFYRRDFTSVMLIPRKGVEIAYAQANYSADGRGPAGMTGSAPATPSYWKTWVCIDCQLTEQELAIAELWASKIEDFPQKNPLSSMSYDAEALRQYIADTLDILYSETQIPQLETREYKLDESFIKNTIPTEPRQIPNIPKAEAVLETLLKDNNLPEAEKAKISSLVNTLPREIIQQFTAKYEAAEIVSRDSRWKAYSSLRPWTQSSEYRELIQFCREKGQAIWLLIFQQLDSDNPHFAGGLIVDITLPEYLFYLEKTREYSREEGNKSVFPPGEPDIINLC